MPRSGYSREDRVASRSGYVSHNHDPVDHRGGPESHSGRLNRARMNERASPDTFPFSLEPQAVGLHIPRGQLYSSAATELSGTPPRDDLYRSEPSQEYERRTRGYNPGFHGERVPSFSSSPQLRGLDHGYRDEEDWPRSSPIKIDFEDYKRDERRGKGKAIEYGVHEKKWNESKGRTTYLPPHLRDEDSFDQRQSLLAADVSRSWESASQKRIDHNDNYIAHWPREKRSGHKEAVTYAQKKSVKYGREVQKHRDSRNGRWRDKWESDLDEYFPEDDE